MFDSWDTSKLEDWLSDIETAADILRENQACLAEAESWGLTHNLICKALQAVKSWGNIWDILHLKLCNANIHTYTSHFMEIQQKENDTLATYINHFKTKAKRCDFSNYTASINIFVKGLKGAHNIAEKAYKRTPRLYLKWLNWWRN